MAKCKRCKAEITWRVTTRGKSAPVDVEDIWLWPGRDGLPRRVVITDDGEYLTGKEAPPEAPDAVVGHESHYSSCPHGAEFRKRTSESRGGLQGLTVKQPFASAIIHGPKRVENRSYRLSFPQGGQWLAIHAGASFFFKVREWPDELAEMLPLWPGMPMTIKVYPRGAILGLCRLVGCWKVEHLPEEYRSRWAVGPWCWVLDSVVALDEPIPAKGQQGLWALERAWVDTMKAALIALLRERRGE